MNFFLNIFEFDIVLIIFASVFLGGIIKGTVGIGMSMFSVPIIAFFLPPTTAILLLCIPVLITNIIQMNITKGIGSFRFFPMFIALILGIIIGCNLILEINLPTISQIIAVSIIFAAIINLFGINIKYINPNLEKKLTVPLGFFSGIIGGLSTMYSPYILAYLVSINLEKETLIRTMATLYFIGSIIIYPMWIFNGLGTFNDLIWSAFLVLPAILGQKIGTSIRSKFTNENFKKAVLYTLMIIGISLLIKNI